uniref:(S)-ureidoglycine aminohydrolase cupin domain-containing protein n=1 Tax=Chaetoceros debilis TaxID=122233 RepID=A0A7S3Q8Q0_9STRA
MDSLITVIPESEVTAAYKKAAKEWTKWDSKNRKSFPYNYTAEERVLVLEGSATLTPSDGTDPVTIEAGNAVTFHKGFKCKWKITKRMKKYYTVIIAADDGEDDLDLPAIICDICSDAAGCVEESYFVAKDEIDICPKCYAKEKDKYPDAEHQKGGEAWVLVEPVSIPAPASEKAAAGKKKKKATTGPAKKKQKKK